MAARLAAYADCRVWRPRNGRARQPFTDAEPEKADITTHGGQRMYRAGIVLGIAAALTSSLAVSATAGTPAATNNSPAISLPLAAGDLDPSFGTSGKVTTALADGSIAEAVVAQADGKIVAVGQA